MTFLRTLGAAVAAAGLVAVVPAPAHAARFCVGGPCGGIPAASAAVALQNAESAPGADEVVLAAGTYDGPLAYTGDDPVEIIGAGRTQTRIRLVNSSLYALTLLHGKVRGLTVEASGPETGGLLLADAIAEDVTATSRDVRPAVRLDDGGELRNARAASATGVGVVTACATSCAVRDSELEGYQALQTQPAGGTLALDGIRARGDAGGLNVDGMDATVTRSLVLTTGGRDAGIVVADGTLSARHLTVVSRSGQQSVGIAVLAGTRAASAIVDRSVLSGHATSVLRGSGGQHPADITVRGSAWARGAEAPPTGPGSLTVVAPSVDLTGRSPGFADDLLGDYRPGPGSPLVDAVPGPPAPAWADLEGRPAADGDADGIAQADIGAFEGAAGVSPKPPAGGTPTGTPPAGTPPAGQPPTPGAPRDGRAPRCRVRAKRSGSRIVLAGTCDEAARLRVTVRLRGGRSIVRTIAVRRGAFRRSLPATASPDRIRAIGLRATDVAGNAARTLRIARPKSRRAARS